MIDDGDRVEPDEKRDPAECPLCRTEDAAQLRDDDGDWTICTQCGHPWAYADS